MPAPILWYRQTTDMTCAESPNRHEKCVGNLMAERNEIREHLLRDAIFSGVLDDAVKEIDAICVAFTQCSDSQSTTADLHAGVCQPLLEDDPEMSEPAAETTVHELQTSVPGEEADGCGQSIAAPDALQPFGGTDKIVEPVKVFLVSCFCERGKHRSVAFC